MKKYYFIFGSSAKFPYKNTYLVVVAPSRDDAVKAFDEKYPCVSRGCLNCSDTVSEDEWPEYYGWKFKDTKPAEVIWAHDCYGKMPEGFDDVFIFVPSAKQVVRISEGTGDNLLPEDQEQGYVDYIYYDQHSMDVDMPLEDGGQIMLDQLVREKYKCLAESIPDVLDMAYGNMLENCMILA